MRRMGIYQILVLSCLTSSGLVQSATLEDLSRALAVRPANEERDASGVLRNPFVAQAGMDRAVLSAAVNMDDLRRKMEEAISKQVQGAIPSTDGMPGVAVINGVVFRVGDMLYVYDEKTQARLSLYPSSVVKLCAVYGNRLTLQVAREGGAPEQAMMLDVYYKLFGDSSVGIGK